MKDDLFLRIESKVYITNSMEKKKDKSNMPSDFNVLSGLKYASKKNED